MRIALAGAAFRNGDVPFNLQKMRFWMGQAQQQGAELVCFGEAFVQGFDAFSWTYEKDRKIAVSVQDELFLQLLALTDEYRMDLLFGFLEKEGDKLYSSCALLGGGRLVHLYRRVSVGWKEYTITDDHYCEGDTVEPFEYRGRKCLIALCGDLWDVTAPRFMQGQEITFWPVYVNFSRKEWEQEERQAYAAQAALFGGEVLMINCADADPDMESPALGGCFRFGGGQVKEEWPLGSEGMLTIDI